MTDDKKLSVIEATRLLSVGLLKDVEELEARAEAAELRASQAEHICKTIQRRRYELWCKHDALVGRLTMAGAYVFEMRQAIEAGDYSDADTAHHYEQIQAELNGTRETTPEGQPPSPPPVVDTVGGTCKGCYRLVEEMRWCVGDGPDGGVECGPRSPRCEHYKPEGAYIPKYTAKPEQPNPEPCEHRHSLGDDGDWYSCDLTRDKPCDEEMHRTCETRLEDAQDDEVKP